MFLQWWLCESDWSNILFRVPVFQPDYRSICLCHSGLPDECKLKDNYLHERHEWRKVVVILHFPIESHRAMSVPFRKRFSIILTAIWVIDPLTANLCPALAAFNWWQLLLSNRKKSMGIPEFSIIGADWYVIYSNTLFRPTDIGAGPWYRGFLFLLDENYLADQVLNIVYSYIHSYV
jgi:hypothetical protein